MKRNFTLLLASVLSAAPLFAQQHIEDTRAIAEAEMKASHAPSGFGMNMNTGNYDLVYQRLELQADPAVHFISGTITSHFTAKEDMDEITFDLVDDLDVTSVTHNGNNLAFLQNSDDELVITLEGTLAEGELDSVTVTYSGVPPIASDSFVTSEHEGTPILWTLSQPYGSKFWWPCKHDLIDKVDSIDVYITAPDQYVSVSNGVEQSQVLNGDGTLTTHFKHNYPIPAYLVAIAITNYTVFTQMAGTAPNEFPIVNYVYPENLDFAQESLEVTPSIVELFEDLFETYPYSEEKYGHAQCGFGGGMEHATVSFVGSFGRNLVAHELAHQWFGDKVTCGSWQDLWLNEGAATYLSGLVIEHLDGNDSFRTWKGASIDFITSLPDGSVYVPANDTLNEARLFSNRLTYNKGGMVFHMLRHKLGDANFYQGLKNYLADEDLAYDYVKTPQLQAKLEEASGLDLTEFFNDWVYNEGHPTYEIIVDRTVFGQVTVTINQSQSHPSVDYFEAPVPMRFTGSGGGLLDVVLENTENGQEFVIPVSFNVTGSEFDPERNIISASNEVVMKTSEYLLSIIKLYPNPASGQLNVQIPKEVLVEKAIFYNTLGQKVLESSEAASWNIAGLSAGMHFITLVTNHGTTQLRFVKAP